MHFWHEDVIVSSFRGGDGSHQCDDGPKAARVGRLVIEHATVDALAKRRHVLLLVPRRWCPPQYWIDGPVLLAVLCTRPVGDDDAVIVSVVCAVPRVWLHEQLVAYGLPVVALAVD